MSLLSVSTGFRLSIAILALITSSRSLQHCSRRYTSLVRRGRIHRLAVMTAASSKRKIQVNSAAPDESSTVKVKKTTSKKTKASAVVTSIDETTGATATTAVTASAAVAITNVRTSTKLSKDEYFTQDTVTPLPITDDIQNECFKIMSWNVAGLRAIIRNDPLVLNKLVMKHTPDVLCLQETKLQDIHVNDHKHLLADLGYTSYWICSSRIKGYAGTVIFVKNDSCGIDASNASSVSCAAVAKKSEKQQKISSFFTNKATTISATAPAVEAPAVEAPVAPAPVAQMVQFNRKVEIVNVKYDLDDDKHNNEGRTITIEFDSFYLIACYVPNSGEGLKRLDYRLKEWDPDMQKYMQTLRQKKPVVYAGDLNVAHLDIDIHNHDAKHITKTAGLTKEERKSFGEMLLLGYVDAFRHFYPDAQGHFTYWNQKNFSRNTNKGLRIDYFVCSNDLIPPSTDTSSSSSSSSSMSLYDSYCIHDDTVGVSDHCPVVLVLKKKSL